MPKVDEFQIQRALCLWLDGYPDPTTKLPTRQPALVPGAEYWAVPNGGSRRDAFEGKRLKESGLRPGVHDLHFLHSGRLYGLEMKQPGGVLSPAQEAMHPRLLRAGMAGSAVVDSLQGARNQLFQWALTVFC